MSKRHSTRAAARQPRNAPSVAAGFRSFVVCILLAGIIGSAVRLYFSPLRIENFIRSQIEKQNLAYKIDFKNARLTLARGFLPTFAIDVAGVSVAHFAPCATEPFVEVSVLMLPVDWFKLLVGKIQLGSAVADGVSVSVDRAKCLKSLSALQLPAIPDDRIPAQRPQQAKPWFNLDQFERIKKSVAGLQVRNGTIYFDESKKFVQLSYVDVWHKDLEVKLDGEVILPAELTYGEKFPPLRFSGSVTPEVAKLKARSSFAEGELAAAIELVQTENTTEPYAKVLVQAGAMPLSIFSDFLRKLGVLSNAKLQPQFLWLNCDVSSEGPLRKLLKQTALEIDNCRVEGDAGRIDIGPAVRNAEGKWQPFKIQIKDFSIQDLLRTFGEKGPSGVLSSFGTVKGTLEYLGEEQLSFQGALEGLEVYFSNRNVRAYQKVSSVEIQATRSAQGVEGKILNVVLEPGRLTGEIAFDFDKRLSSGSVTIDTRELSLDPRIEKLMADGLFESLALNGLLKVRDHKLASWSGQVQAAAYTGSQLKVAKPTLETKFANGRFDITAYANTGELSPDSRWLGWIKRAASDLKISSPDSLRSWIPISNLKSQISIQPNLIGWSNATFTANKSRVQVTSTGEVVENKSVAGLLTIFNPEAANRKFIISGSAQSPTLTPHD